MAYILDQTHEERIRRYSSQRYGLYLAIVGMIMLFAAMASAYIVRRSAGNWLEFELPSIFFTNTLVIILSSITLHLSWTFFKKGEKFIYQSLLCITFVLGIAFVVLQYQGWLQMTEAGLYLQVNPSASFIYVISGLHAAHLIGGIGTLIVALAHAFKLKFKVSELRKHRFELVLIYWHFLGVLWLFLLVFFMYV